MEFPEYMRIKSRMTKEDCGCCSIMCVDCPLSNFNNGSDMNCVTFELTCPDKAQKILSKWAEDNPEETLAHNFFEKYPNAPKDSDGLPRLCPWLLGYQDISEESCDGDCSACWNKVLR